MEYRKLVERPTDVQTSLLTLDERFARVRHPTARASGKVSVMVSRLIDRARWFYKTVRLVKNWPEVYWRKFLSQSEGRQVLKLRSGLLFEVAHKDHAFPIIAEVLHERVYGEALSVRSSSPIVIDIGANIGAASPPATRRSNSSST